MRIITPHIRRIQAKQTTQNGFLEYNSPSFAIQLNAKLNWSFGCVHVWNAVVFRLDVSVNCPKRNAKEKSFEGISTDMFLTEKPRLWLVPKTSFKNRPLFRSGNATPQSQKSVMIYSTIRASLFAYKLTCKDVQNTCRPYSAPF